MEMSGNAFLNREKLWIPLHDVYEYIEEGTFYLFKAGIDFRFYNFPLCMLPQKFWAIAEKSISAEKIAYLYICKDCLKKQLCGGFFAASRSFMEKEITAYV